MVPKRKQHNSKNPVKQGRGARAPRSNKIGASTPYHFRGKNLTPYGGLLPVAILLEKLGFQALLEQTITTQRITRAMSSYQFVLALVLGLYVGFARLHQLRFIARDPILTGILQVTRLPPQSTLWRFLASLHLNVAQQILSIQRQLRERVWAAAHVRLDHGDAGHRHHRTHALRPPDGRAQELQPQEQGQAQLPADTDLAGGDARISDGRVARRRPARGPTDRRPPGERLPGFAGRREADLGAGRFRLLLLGGGSSLRTSALSVRHRARKTRRLVEQLQQAAWKPSPHSDADAQCAFRYQPQGWAQA